LSIGRHAVQEFTFAESPFGLAGRLRDRLTGGKPTKDGDERETAGADQGSAGKADDT